jgi:phosphatidylserine decarboxylase
MVQETPVVTKFLRERPDDSWTVDAALAAGAYGTLDAAFAMTPEELITLVQESGLRGKGGAGFGTGQKWSFLPKDVYPRYLAVNGDEGEPCTFKDHMLVERDPHQIIEGVILTAYAIQAHHAFIYLRGEFALGAERLGQALADAYARGFVGANIKGSGFDLEIILHRGAGCYIAGDETGLLSSLEGERAMPRIKFVAIGAGVSLLLFLLWPPLAWLAVLVTAWIAYFFRDPPRVTPLREGLVVAPADGRICAIERVRPPAELGLGETERLRVSIFLSIFDVHINRAPVAGRVIRSIYVPGSFLNAAADKASDENERRGIVIDSGGDSEIAMVQIAGLIARRIVTFVNEGDSVGVGERVGLIRFGSRVDLYLPPGRGALVAVGQRAIGGETVVADLRSSEPEREARAQ